MDEWILIFETVQLVVQTADSPIDGLSDLIAFAKAHPDIFADAAFWKRAANHPIPFDALIERARAGFLRVPPFDPVEGASVILLDCGDCPETFVMSLLELAPETSYESLMHFVTSSSILSAQDFPALVLSPELDAPLNADTIADVQPSWAEAGLYTCDWNGYLLWLCVATLALIEPLHDPDFCAQILNGRERIILLSGYEEIFLYAGTITADGLVIEAV